jgi:peptidoglycan hydrolase FlgJ
MAIQQTASNALAADARSLNALKLQAGQDSPAAIKEAAKQFESLFMRELIKSMRDATMKSGLMDNAQGDLGTDLLDQQLAVTLSGTPGGLADVIAKQLSKQMGTADGKLPVAPAPKSLKMPGANAAPASVSQTGFVQRHSEVAARIEQTSGIPASFMLGQAGHETGWGKHEIRNKDGSTSFNLFGIKAGAGWNGKVAEVTTTEYVDGVPRKTVAKFRAYDSYEDSFKDYARLINESPRYAQARQSTGSSYAFASELKRAGYATDPEYASKLSRAINSTLRVQRAMV